MIILIFGKPGFGKTALNTYFAVKNTLDRQRYKNTCLSIDELNRDGYNFSKPSLPHSVFTNYTVFNKCKFSRGKFTYILNPFEFSLPTDEMKYSIFPPYASLHIQEAQRVLNSRKSRHFRACVSGAYENHRHIDLDIYLDMQRPKLADSNIRELVTKFIAVLGMVHKRDNMNRIISTTWYTLEFDDWAICEKYVNSNDEKLGVYNSYTFEGNIFKCYNSKCNKIKFYDKGANFDFSYITSDNIDKVDMVAPDNYLEK